MKKSKLIRAVAAVTMSAVSAAACFGTTACAHKHTWGDYIADGANGHYRECTSNDGGHTDIEDHVWGDDDVCDLCGYNRGTSVDPEPENKIIEPTLTEADDEEPETDADGYIVSVNEFKPSDLTAQTYASAYSTGIFTIGAGTTVRGRNIASVTDVNTNEVVATPGTDGEGAITNSVQLQNDDVNVSLTTKTAGTLIIWVSNGSTGKETGAIKINGTSYSYGGSGGWQITYEVPAAGTYKITRNGSINGTSDIYYMAFTTRVENTAVEKIQIVNGGTVDYYVGQRFDGSDVSASAIHEETERISDIKTGRLRIDYSEFDNTKAGTYEILVSYTKDGKTYETTYDVKVYDFESLTYDTKYTVKEATNSAAGNGVYATHWLKDLYFKNATINDDGLVVILNGKNGSETKSFALKAGEYTLSGADTSSTGKKTVTVTVSTNGITKQATFDIYVIESVASEVASLTEVKTRVNANCTDAQLGTKNAADEYQFKTVRQALEFYEDLNLGASVKKTINLDAGNYWEKLEVRIPNLTILGAGASSTKIEYDELWGVPDVKGFEQTTDSTATLNVRDTAVNFTIKGVTISNYYNTSDSFAGSISPKGERALAMLVQADKVIVQDCVLLGWQDTLELFTGRQYFVNSVIKGTTDFIFGTNNTTYFYQCEIQTIINKNTNGGGYITAMKGQNKGSTDKITYGVIFDDCDFTYENGVPAGTAAIGRTWGADAAVMIMNSRLGAHISSTYNKRYVSMNNNDPAKAQFMEYNNTGAGALSSASNNYWTVPSAETAANYNDISVIFGTTNGLVTYADAWDINKTVTVHYGESSTVAVKVPYGAKATYSNLVAGVVLPSGYGVEGVYSDSTMTKAFDYNTVITEDTEVYVKSVELVDVDLTIADLLASGVTYTSASGETSTLNTNVGTGDPYAAGSIDLTNGIVATFDGYVKFNNVKPNNTSSSWALDWSKVDGNVNYDTYITLGNASAANRYLAVSVKAGCTIKVYCAATVAGRTATIGTVAEGCADNQTVNGTTVLASAAAKADGEGFILQATVTEAGTYYINCSSAVSFFRIVVEY